jgi:hypothetical protein
LEFEPAKAHLKVTEQRTRVTEMLYQDKTLGQASLGRRLAARMLTALSGKRYADLDLLSMSPHLQRDLGLDHVSARPSSLDIWRK